MSGTQAVIISMTFSAVALVFILLRCSSRIFFVGRVLKEDILICVAMVWSFGLSGAIEVGMFGFQPDNLVSLTR
jgi:hypothetical protein